MITPKCCSCKSLIKNTATVKADNTQSYEATCSTILIQPTYQPIYLMLNQCASVLKNNLIYYLYVVNSYKSAISNIKLKDTLPTGVNFISTFIENGEFKYYNNEIFYNIDLIEPRSFCKIVVIVQPTTLGKKTNSIEVICNKPHYILNNPCEITCMLGLKLEYI